MTFISVDLGGKVVSTAVSLQLVPQNSTCLVTATPVTITLPPLASVVDGMRLLIKDYSGTASFASLITIDGSGSETIDGDLTKTISGPYQTMILVKTPTSWCVGMSASLIGIVASFSQKNGGVTAAYQALLTDRVVDYIAVPNSDVTVTLQPANTLIPGTVVTVTNSDGSSSAAANITVIRSGADTVNGGAGYTMNVAYGTLCLMTDGVSKWVRVQG